MHLTSWRGAVALALGALFAPAHAQPFGTPVGADQLAAMRGGFASATGLQVAIGIERLVMINGEVVARTSVDLGNLSRPAAFTLVQNGPGNVYQAQLAHLAAGGIVIQNSLSDQRIASQTTINASVNSIDLIKSLNFQGSLSDALARAAAPH